MADFDQHEYFDGKFRRVGAKSVSKDGSFEFEEHQMWDYKSVSSNVSNGSSSNPIPNQVFSNISSSSSSAPMAIPDWRKIYGTRQVTNEEEFFKVNDVEDGYEDEMIPPHEYIAKKLSSRSQISSFSVIEGAGRTLKGRDLCRVRNAILTKTGFLE